MKMNKKIIAGIGTAGLLAFGSQIQINPAPLTPNEWQTIAQMYDYEIKTSGGSITIPNFQDNGTDSYKQLNAQIRKRVPSENEVIIDDKPVTATEYSNFRENMMKKVENKTILEAIIQ